MTVALIILHAAPEAENPRADTAVRLAGDMLAESKDVRLFLAGPGVRLLFPSSSTTESTHACSGNCWNWASPFNAVAVL
ncbi:MAG: hypothetical protein ACYDCX_12230 [Acidithiobacillus sp.]